MFKFLAILSVLLVALASCPSALNGLNALSVEHQFAGPNPKRLSFQISPCEPLALCSGQACLSFGVGSASFNVGRNPTYSITGDRQMTQKMSGIYKCFDGSTTHATGTKITYICDSSQSGDGALEIAPDFVSEECPASQTPTIYTFTWRTDKVCDLSQGSSFGTVFWVLFFLTVILYLGIGIAFKTIAQGARGIEAIPQIDMWRELPSLCKDGITFWKSKMSKGSKTTSYETL
ncbi:hypothetical protein PCE1_003463 [Barthelona sp. PCE]